MNVKTESPVDFEAALDTAGGDYRLLRTLVDLFVEEVPQMLTSLRQAVELRDPRQLQESAHQLKGVVRYLHVDEAYEYTYLIEAIAESGPHWPMVEDLLDRLTLTLEPALQTLAEYAEHSD